jgi:hypothetical protein
MTRRVLLACGTGLLLLCALNCGPGGEQTAGAPASSDEQGRYPATARVAIHEQFLEDLALLRHPSDGGGSVALVLAEGQDGSISAGGWGRWEFEYTAGPLGISAGGSLFLLVPPFWGWSTPQGELPDRPGFTTVDTDGPGLELSARTVDRNLLQVEIGGRDLAPGETLRLVYGAGAGLAKADDYAESRSKFYFKVDGDGDGLSGLVADTPAIEVLPGPPARLTAALSSTTAPGGSAALTVAVLDAMASAGCRVAGQLELESVPPGLELSESIALEPADSGRLRLDLVAPVPGIFRVRVTFRSAELEESVLSNPLRVAPDQTPVFWADLHGHSGYSDGTGTPRHYFEYARDVAGLDMAVLTDHDHFGVRFLDATPAIWDEIRAEVEAFNEPGRFVALLGYEWTSWLYGHRHVLYFDGQGEVLTSVGATTTTPAELWAALSGRAALTFAHHSAGGPVATDWSYVPDPRMEPVTEIMSVHGSSEASDSPSRIYSAVRGNFVRDQLDRGFAFGFIGSGDGHDGHPGHAHLSPNAGYRRARPDPLGRRADERQGNGGVAAVRASELSPDALLEAFRERQVYATSGPRILLDTTLAGRAMGSTLRASDLEDPALLRVEVAGTSGVEYVEVIRKGARNVRFPFEGALDGQFDEHLSGLSVGDYVYVRLVQNDGVLAWSSPFYIE